MSTLDKVVKSACKPKNAAPKSKYIDTLVAATYSDDGSLQDIIRSLSLRLREPNPVVVLKALIVLHTLLRTGQSENLLTHLQSDQLRLRNVGSTNWEGSSHPPSNMGPYAMYLDARTKCFKEIKHDVVRTQSESNRRGDGPGGGAAGPGSKARRLRHLGVDKGLLREVKAIQRVLDALVVCRFYEDDLHDENTVIAFRMCVKDLLVLFQAGNEGVCNILEHYFEMSKSDATDALAIYKSFIAQTDRVVDFLAVAKKLHNILNVPVPNLKHAPTGLVKALDEYLNDPNFEQNRLEYKRSLGVVEGTAAGAGAGAGGDVGGVSGPGKAESKTPATSSTSTAPSTNAGDTSKPASSTAAAATASAPPGANQKIQDFFESIQADQQPTMFGGPATNYPQPQPQMMPMFTGMPMMSSPWGASPQSPFGQLQPQMTGANPFRQSMMMPQQTGFMQPQMTGQMAFGGAGGGMPFMQPQQTGYKPMAQSQPQQQQGGFLQPQATGGAGNPFRQSMMMPGGSSPFSGQTQHASSQPASPFQPQATGFGFGSGTGMAPGQSPFGLPNQGGAGLGAGQGIQRPGSTPALSINTNPNGTIGKSNGSFGGMVAGGANKTPHAQPLTAQPTGSKNPFAPASGIAPAVPSGPKQPSMNELAANKYATFNGLANFNTGFAGGQTFGEAGASSQNGFGGAGFASVSGNAQKGSGSGDGGMGDIASSFAFDSDKKKDGNDWLSQFGSLSVNNNGQSAADSQISANPAPSSSTGFGGSLNGFSSPNRATSPLGANTGSAGGASFTLQPQRTGFGGSTIKPFKPTSSFGSTLMEGLPTVSEGGGSGAGPGQGQAERPALMSFESGSGSGSGFGAQQMQGQNKGQDQASSGLTQHSASPFGQQHSGFGQFGQNQPFGSKQNPVGQGNGQAQTSVGSGLLPQPTGMGNPFRQSTMGTGMGSAVGNGINGSSVSFGSFGQSGFGTGNGNGQQRQQQHGLI